MKVLVLGGCGFIGSHIVEKLVKHNHEVRVFDRLNASVRNIASVLSDVELVYGDFSDEWATKKINEREITFAEYIKLVKNSVESRIL